jgi:hypothetical protein
MISWLCQQLRETRFTGQNEDELAILRGNTSRHNSDVQSCLNAITAYTLTVGSMGWGSGDLVERSRGMEPSQKLRELRAWSDRTVHA